MRHLLIALVLVPAALAQDLGPTNAFIGLLGGVMNASRDIAADLDGALAGTGGDYSASRPAYESAVARHVLNAQNLRTAFAIQVTKGTSIDEPVAGLSREQLAQLDPTSLYYQASHAHRRLNERLSQVLMAWAGTIPEADAAAYRARLAEAVRVVGIPGRAAAP